MKLASLSNLKVKAAFAAAVLILLIVAGVVYRDRQHRSRAASGSSTHTK
jgi:hypothetical protein